MRKKKDKKVLIFLKAPESYQGNEVFRGQNMRKEGKIEMQVQHLVPLFSLWFLSSYSETKDVAVLLRSLKWVFQVHKNVGPDEDSRLSIGIPMGYVLGEEMNLK